MANLPETQTWETGIYCIEVTDKLLGGIGGVSNKQGIQLGNRTAWLKTQVEDLQVSQPLELTEAEVEELIEEYMESSESTSYGVQFLTSTEIEAVFTDA